MFCSNFKNLKISHNFYSVISRHKDRILSKILTLHDAHLRKNEQYFFQQLLFLLLCFPLMPFETLLIHYQQNYFIVAGLKFINSKRERERDNKCSQNLNFYFANKSKTDNQTTRLEPDEKTSKAPYPITREKNKSLFHQLQETYDSRQLKGHQNKDRYSNLRSVDSVELRGQQTAERVRE